MVVVVTAGKQDGMPVTVTPTEAGPCLGCGELVPVEAAFCPTCGTRQVADRPMPVTVDAEETRALERSTNVWLLAAVAAVALLLLGLGIVVGRLVASPGGGGGGDSSSDGATAEAMDAYAPIGGGWMDKHVHLAEESSGDDGGVVGSGADGREDIGDKRLQPGEGKPHCRWNWSTVSPVTGSAGVICRPRDRLASEHHHLLDAVAKARRESSAGSARRR